MPYRNKKTYRCKGGDITNQLALRKILSIGYELETASLTKLTLSDTIEPIESDGSPYDKNGGSINSESVPIKRYLFNSDTARKDIEGFEAIDEEEEQSEDMLLRLEETVKMPIFKYKKKNDPKSLFYITNDLGDNRFNKTLLTQCKEFSNELVKDDIYSFRTLDKQEEFIIKFLYHNETDCGTFSNVEWLFTYLNPSRSKNVILDTFTKSVQTLIAHLSKLEKIEGNLVSNIHGIESVLHNPEKRILYHYPDSNLYYLQSHVFRKIKGMDIDLEKELDIDDICSTTQMTFSCKVKDAFSVMTALVEDTVNSIPVLHDILGRKGNFNKMVEECANKIVSQFYETVKIECRKKNKEEENPEDIFYTNIKKNYAAFLKVSTKKIITNYVGLILYKLLTYYNDYLTRPAETRQYFKNLLSFNVRHTNYELYVHLKRFLAKLASMDENDVILQHIVRKLFINESILMEFIEDPSVLRKNAFKLTNIIDRASRNYGKPEFSLVSYFLFFEEPDNTDYNLDENDQYIYYDWLQFKKIDAFSAKMELKNDIILIECRFFYRLLSIYLYGIADKKMKTDMRQGICNILNNTLTEELGKASIKHLRYMVDHYLEMKRTKTNKTRKIGKN